MIIGKRLRTLREEKGLSRRELAERVGIAESQIVRYETEKSDATTDVLARLAKVLDVNGDYLIGVSDSPSSINDSSLAPDEVALIAARRRGDFREAIKLLVPDE